MCTVDHVHFVFTLHCQKMLTAMIISPVVKVRLKTVGNYKLLELFSQKRLIVLNYLR